MNYTTLGSLSLRVGSKTLTPERKTAAVLLYLALEGPTSRSRLAGLLWPDSGEATARNNLAQALRRLKQATEVVLVTGQDRLSLHAELVVDAARLRVLVFQGELQAALALRGDLFGDYDYDDLPEFSDWLWGERERLRTLRQEALGRLIDTLEQQGRYREALPYAEQLVGLDPVSERGYRQQMRLCYLAGDRAAALAVYQRCVRVLRDELGITPLAETRALAEQIEQDAPMPARRAPVAVATLPLEVMRPPQLVGREDAWQCLEEGWSGARALFVCGDPGSGKSRLAVDFAASRGSHLHIEARPGDAVVPFAACVRLLRALLAVCPVAGLEPWVVRELARILPDVLPERADSPAQSDGDKLRLFEAVGVLVSRSREHYVCLVLDDLHYLDDATHELLHYLISRFYPHGEAAPRLIGCFRPDELAAEPSDALQRLADNGLAVQVGLEPLSEAAIQTLLASLPLPADLPSAASFRHYAGGNPLFTLETLKHLLESGVSKETALRLPGGGKVEGLLRRRLGRLEPLAHRLAQAAAVLGRDLSLDLVADVLGQPPLDLLESWQALEKAQILDHDRFAHDLLLDVTRSTLSAPVAALLHARAAEVLSARNAHPGRVAQHWLASSDPSRAVPLFIRAAERAEHACFFPEAQRYYQQALGVAEAHTDTTTVFDILDKQAALLHRYDTGSAHERVVGKLLSLAASPEQWARAYFAQSSLYYDRGQGEVSEHAAREGLRHAEQCGDVTLQSQLLLALGTALWLQDRFNEAQQTLLKMLSYVERQGGESDRAAAHYLIGSCLLRGSRFRAARRHYERACDGFTALGDSYRLAATLNHLGVTHLMLGESARGLSCLQSAEAKLDTMSGTLFPHYLNAINQATLYLFREHYDAALGYLAKAETAAQTTAYSPGALSRTVAYGALRLGQFERCAQQLEDALEHPDATDPWRHLALIVRAVLAAQTGQPSEQDFRQAEEVVGTSTPLLLAYLWLEHADHHPGTALSDLESAYKLIAEHSLVTLQSLYHLRYARHLLRGGYPDQALAHSERARQLPLADQIFVERAEPELLHYEICSALGRPEALGALRAAYRWLSNVASAHVPEAFRETFWQRNPLNYKVYREAHRHGLVRTAAPDPLATPATGKPPTLSS